MMPPPPPSAADMASSAAAAAAASLPPLPADDYYEDDFEDDDDDMQLDDDELPSAAAAASGGGDMPTSSPSTSSTDDDDHFRNPNSTGTPADAPPNGLDTPEAKRQPTFPSMEDSRRLFQRLWTDEDEIIILKGFYDFTWRRGTTHHAHQHDTGPFYEQIRSKLQLEFTKNQLVEKIRRLKKKYRNVVARMASGRDFAFKSPHDLATFEISQKIWSSASPHDCYDEENGSGNGREYQKQLPTEQVRRRRRRRRAVALATVGVSAEAVPVEVKLVPALAPMPVDVKPVPVIQTSPVDIKPVPMLGNYIAEVKPVYVAPRPPTSTGPNVVEETVKSCIAPLFKELLSCAMSGSLTLGMGGASSMAIGLFPAGLRGGNPPLNGVKDGASEGKWRKQQISELEVYSKRLELLQEQIKVTLEELRSSE